MIPNKANYSTTIDGKQTELYVLQNSALQVAISNYGGRVVSILVPDKDGKITDVALGYEKLASYQKDGEPYFGALIGRYGNRIGNGQFSLEGKKYQLIANNGTAALHGGPTGFHARVWDVEKVTDDTLELMYVSKDGEEGYPGNLTVNVRYSLTGSALKIEYSATTDQVTVLNLTNHTYFNLNGQGSGEITDHILQIKADRFTPIDQSLIPTGELRNVESTPFDFRKPTSIGERVDWDDEQLKFAGGYDHNFVLTPVETGLKSAAVVKGGETGIQMEVLTTEPGMQFYCGNFLKGKDYDGKGGKNYPFRTGFCLETQHFPDSPNKPQFPLTVLRPGDVYQTTTMYKFSVQ